MRFLSSRNSFLDPFGGPKEVKIDQKSSLEDIKNEESEKVDFSYPSLAKSLFLGCQDGQEGAPMKSNKRVLKRLKNNDGRMMRQ